MRILERLRLEAERHSHAILASQSDWSAVSPTSQICQLSPTKTSVVFVEQQVMPFHFHDVSEVVWESMKQHCVQHDQWFKQVRNSALIVCYPAALSNSTPIFARRVSSKRARRC